MANNLSKKAAVNIAKNKTAAEKEALLPNDGSNGKSKFNYVKNVYKFLSVYVIVYIAAAVVFAVFGLKIAIEFKGGTLITYSYTGELNTEQFADDARTKLGEIEGADMSGIGTINVTKGESFGEDSKTTITLSFSSENGLTGEIIDSLTEKMKTSYPDSSLILESSQDVNPSSGKTFFIKCLTAVGVSFILLVIYIAFRFSKIGGISAGLFGILALFLDVLVVFSAFIFFRYSIDSNFIAVSLTILGYSINNTIVVFDRIRENKSLFGRKVTVGELVNTSSAQSYTRSLYTTMTTVFALIVIIIVAAVSGVTSIMSFAVPMLFGMISGFFSSLFISGALWARWSEKHPDKDKKGHARKANAITV